MDRAALDVAIELGIACGGWCPARRGAEDGPIDARYPLKEAPSPIPAVRTRLNATDSDATLILSPSPLTGGTALTRRIAEKLGRPLCVVDPGCPEAAGMIADWLTERSGIAVLNVAGPRESSRPGIHDRSVAVLIDVFSRAGVAIQSPP